MKSRLAAAAGAVVVAGAILLACSGNTASDEPSVMPPADGFAVGPSGGTFIKGGVVLTVPAGAVASNVTITVTAEKTTPAGYTNDGTVYHFAPSGLHFAAPVAVTFPGKPAPAQMIFWTVDGSEDRYEPLGTTIDESGATAQVTHFSSGFVGSSTTGITCTYKYRTGTHDDPQCGLTTYVESPSFWWRTTYSDPHAAIGTSSQGLKLFFNREVLLSANATHSVYAATNAPQAATANVSGNVITSFTGNASRQGVPGLCPIGVPLIAVECSGGNVSLGGSASPPSPAPPPPPPATDAGTRDATTTDSGNDAATDAGSDAAPAVAPSEPLDVAATPASGLTVSTLAGDGTTNILSTPMGVTLDTAGNAYVADYGDNRIVKVTPDGVVTTLAGSGAAVRTDGTGVAAGFVHPTCIAFGVGMLYVGQSDGYVRKVTLSGAVTTIAQQVTQASSQYPAGAVRGIAVDGSTLYASDYNANGIRKFTYLGWATFVGHWLPGNQDGTGTNAFFRGPTALALDSAKNLYVLDSGNGRIRKVTPAGVVTTFSGGSGGVTTDAAGNVYFGDSTIGMLTPSGVFRLLAGNTSTYGYTDGPGLLALFHSVTGLALDGSGTVYVADSKNNRIRKLTANGAGVLSVSWNAPTMSGSSAITGYRAYAVAVGQPTKTCTAAANASTCTISELISGVAYDVSVTAMNAAGTSAPSIAVAATPN